MNLFILFALFRLLAVCRRRARTVWGGCRATPNHSASRGTGDTGAERRRRLLDGTPLRGLPEVEVGRELLSPAHHPQLAGRPVHPVRVQRQLARARR